MARLSVSLNLNGYTHLPPGKIATVVTYLEMQERPRLPRRTKPVDWFLVRLTGDLDRYRDLFTRVGRPWLWFSRLVMPRDQLADILRDPRVEAYALTDGQADLGLLELDFRSRGEAELAYFGLVPEIIGQGAGRFLMNEAIRRAFAKRIGRLFVHTCSLDHPAALPFYIRSGFQPYQRALEVADDPRLAGFLPLDAAPHIPVVAITPSKRARRVVARPRKLTRKSGQAEARMERG